MLFANFSFSYIQSFYQRLLCSTLDNVYNITSPYQSKLSEDGLHFLELTPRKVENRPDGLRRIVDRLMSKFDLFEHSLPAEIPLDLECRAALDATCLLDNARPPTNKLISFFPELMIAP